MDRIRKISLFVFTTVTVFSCIKPFHPASISSANLNMLVVDGFIHPGSASTIKLSRTLNITDSFQVVPELNAQLYLEGNSGSSISFQPGSLNNYTCATPALSENELYRLRIILQNGQEYLSDFVEVKKSPPIDTLEWEEDGNVSIFVSTHDPAAQARYYKWEYDETMEYRATYEAIADWVDNQVVFFQPDEYRYRCYKYFNSNNILIANTSSLSNDVVSHSRITSIPNDNSKIGHRYSILVKQYVLTQEAYKYWQILQNNSEQNGNLFDPQPASLRSNIHSTSNPAEPVVGFFSVSGYSEKRLFIRYSQLKYKPVSEYLQSCGVTFISLDAAAAYLNNSTMRIAYFTSSSSLAIAHNFCVDCRLQGGTTGKPPYW
ncbi:MAG: DUF4249 domain-containing protein [Chitinophagaceae bacterium]|nr:MAG: DUF4249 domain-containing protein [Chitinophagaceae bacterium]